MPDQNAAIMVLRGQLKAAHDVLENTMQDVTPEMASWQPPGVANAIGPNYVHVVVAEDALLNGMGRGAPPLLATGWAGKTGASELPPMDGQWHGWSQSVQVDLPALRAYAQAVYANSDEFVAGLSDADLGNEVDMSAIGFGRQSLGMLLSVLVSNVHWHTGEIACLKGIQGYKGYPF